MKYIFKNEIISYLSLASCFLLLLAIVQMPSYYYQFLRIFIVISAIILAFKNHKVLFMLLAFLLVGYLFNPIVPVYLYQKSIWIPVDIISALLFLVSSFELKRKKTFIPYKNRKTQNKSYGRDKIY
ncbi:DUF6804 family protein [Maribacter flavus]|uniref:DUF6804 family protein n=1 Tax=Maribacter flavus TaxID=1658664 RepID=UPI0037438BBA